MPTLAAELPVGQTRKLVGDRSEERLVRTLRAVQTRTQHHPTAVLQHLGADGGCQPRLSNPGLATDDSHRHPAR